MKSHLLQEQISPPPLSEAKASLMIALGREAGKCPHLEELLPYQLDTATVLSASNELLVMDPVHSLHFQSLKPGRLGREEQRWKQHVESATGGLMLGRNWNKQQDRLGWLKYTTDRQAKLLKQQKEAEATATATAKAKAKAKSTAKLKTRKNSDKKTEDSKAASKEKKSGPGNLGASVSELHKTPHAAELPSASDVNPEKKNKPNIVASSTPSATSKEHTVPSNEAIPAEATAGAGGTAVSKKEQDKTLVESKTKTKQNEDTAAGAVSLGTTVAPARRTSAGAKDLSALMQRSNSSKTSAPSTRAASLSSLKPKNTATSPLGSVSIPETTSQGPEKGKGIVDGVNSSDLPESVASDNKAKKPATEPAEQPSLSFNLPEKRYQQLKQAEERLLKQEQSAAAKRSKIISMSSDPTGGSSILGRATLPKSTKKRKRADKKDTASSALPIPSSHSVTAKDVTDVASSSVSVQPRLTPEQQEEWNQKARLARSKTEEWLEVFRQQHESSKKEKRSTNPNPPLWGQIQAASTDPISSYGPFCRLCNDSGSVRDDDTLLRCLDCSHIACGPRSAHRESKEHIFRHFIKSNHNFAVSCGPRSEVYCFRCGDFVYHPVFDQEKERQDIVSSIPIMGWKEHAIQRSFDPFQFVANEEHGVLWRGMMAHYPSLVPKELIFASRLSLTRMKLFRGDLTDDAMLQYGPDALSFCSEQALSGQEKFRLSAPVGMYNMGNTCFMSCILQCLIHCAPLQKHFLEKVGHHHKSCELLRGKTATPGGAKGKSKCLACEMDILFLKYFGSTVGRNLLAIVDEPMVHSSSDSVERGDPLVPTSLLASAWQSGGMNHLAGYEQRDAHEFLQAFLDIMGKHERQHLKRVQELKAYSKPIVAKKNDDAIPDDIVKRLFEGKLRSVLVCEKCGCKRSQSEEFYNISLPLSKEAELLGGSNEDMIGTRQKSKISLQLCLEHFTAPETLTDPVDCSACGTKTPTQKQITFAKLPKVLCLHLKRFDAARNKKIVDLVSFPAHGLDMGGHLPQWREVGHGKLSQVQDESAPTVSAPEVLYDIFGAVNHQGTLNQGHYVSNVKVNGEWYQCNDAFVEKTDVGDGETEALQSDGAYMLFYMRRE